MTLDEAITHHTWAAQNSEGEVAEEHEQYAAWLWELRKHRHIADTLCANTRAAILERDTYKSENARYRELVEILRRDWRIEASWDGLRKVWYVGLTEDGVRERDERDAKLRELIRAMWFLLCVTGNDDLVAEVEKNGETIRTVEATAIAEKMRELGIEVES